MGTALPWVSSRPSMRAAHLVRLSVKNSLAGLRGASSRHDDAESRTDLHHMLKSCPGCDAAASTKQTLVNIAHHWATLNRLPDRNRLIPDGTNAAASSRGPRLSTVALNKRVQHAEFIGVRLMRSRVACTGSALGNMPRRKKKTARYGTQPPLSRGDERCSRRARCARVVSVIC